MFIRSFGPVISATPQPLWEGEGVDGAAPKGDTSNDVTKTDTSTADATGAKTDQNGSVSFDPATAYAALDEDTRNWLQTKGLDKDPAALAKSAREAERLIGDRVKIPGKDATQEERDAFLNKLGRPAKPEDYTFTVPKDLPENVPYDGERAKQLKTDLHKLGLTGEQASAIHDMYLTEITGILGGSAEHQAAQFREQAEKATEALVKRWGPLDGDTAKANFEIADRVFTDVPGGQELLADLKSKGFVGENKEVLSEALAVFLANIGNALFVEDSVLRGRNDEVGNPFADGEHFNLTKVMKIVKEDPDRAASLIAAAGKKPSDFGLKA
jgi:hypothetical protein